MKWYLYLVTFQLKSPLHIGFHKVGYLLRTRPYVPAKPIWGALTAKLTRALALENYEKVGDFLKKAMRFGYFYVSDGEYVFLPHYTEEGLNFGNLTQVDFESRFITSYISTGIEPSTLAAEEGMLHEVEFISANIIDGGRPVFFKGLVWAREFSRGDMVVRLEEDEIVIVKDGIQSKFSEIADILQVGGDRKYGFGLFRLKEMKKVNGKDLKSTDFIGMWEETEDREVKITLTENQYIWAHVKHHPKLEIKGNIEPIVGRDWDSKGAGRKLSSHGLYWSPGSILLGGETFIIKDFGLWEIR